MPRAQRWSDEYRQVISSEKNQITFRMTPGEYTIRTRSLNRFKVPGPWSKDRSFWVRFKSISNVYPEDGSELIPMSNKIESLTFEWPAVKGAARYFFVLRDKNNNVIEQIETRQTWIKASLPVDNSYSWLTFPMSQRGELKNIEDLDPTDTQFNFFKILPPPDEGRPIDFKIGQIKDAKIYEFEVVRAQGEHDFSAPSFFKSRGNGLKLRLPPGVYEMRARGIYDSKDKGQWGQPEKFVVQLDSPKAINPKDEKLIETFDDLKSPISFSWDRAKEAERFRMTVYDEQGNIIFSEVTTENSIVVPLQEETQYNWIVEAYVPGEDIREPPARPKVTNSFKTEKYIKLSLSSSEEPSQFYGWLKHDSSLVSYQGIIRDLNAVVDQKIYGGTGEGALGYWHRKSDYGILGHAALSGFTIVGRTSTYLNYGLSLGRRFKINERTRLRVWAGYTYYEFSEIRTSFMSNQISFEMIKTTGPQLQISYLSDLTERLGWHVSGQIYQPLASGGSPNGRPVIFNTSYSISLWGTYLINPTYKGMLGYTYKVESLAYGSDDPNGGSNSIDLSGHFLSLRLEFGLQKAYK